MLKTRLRFAVVLTSVVTFAAACSLILDTGKEQCTTDQDCARFTNTHCVNKVCVPTTPGMDATVMDQGAPDVFDPKWGCLGNVKQPSFPKPKVVVSIPLIDLTTKKPVTQIDAKPCGKTDVACMNPIGPTVQPNMSGILTFTVDAGFDGYIELKSNVPPPDGSMYPNYIPSLIFFNPPLSDDTIYLTVPLVSPTALALLAQQFGNQIDPMMGSPFQATYDCTNKPADGVSVAIDLKSDAGNTRTFYFVNGLPTEAVSQTDSTGYSGFINVPPGIRNVTGTLADGGKYVGKISVLVRPSTITYSVLPPTP